MNSVQGMFVYSGMDSLFYLMRKYFLRIYFKTTNLDVDHSS